MVNPPDTVSVRLVAHVPWGDDLPDGTMTVGAEPGWGAFEVPGPRQVPVRAALALAAGPGGVVARVLDPDAHPRPVAVRVGPAGSTFVPLPGPPLALAPRADGGLWMLGADGLRAVGGDGVAGPALPVPGVAAVAADGDAVWVVGLDEAVLVGADGSVVVRAPWADPLGSVGLGGGLGRLDAGEPARVLRLAPDGTLGTTPLPGVLSPFERLVRASAGTFLTSTVGELVRYDDEDVAAHLTWAGAGLSTDGDAFAATVAGGRASVSRGDGGVAVLDLAGAGVPQGRVVAVRDDDVLVWDGSAAAWFRDGEVHRTIDVDDAVFADQVFPHAWRADAPYPFVAGPDGTVLVASSGPTGAAVLAVRWETAQR
ncbi:hypothetical protein Cch01nite_28330 [Cellulomonas chitinilytica]|uniref:Uncharacterized protein n=1 Tax=Cellulomonas chitinilytica TaxID=398759 RepID=A0A919P6Y5_9CELL|nr:hypothetical protein [Cellulomonas chitinilytica]GIG22109.1 hypothetical protein Cch01nite_28330 [Cellulomonas chitinilytica]